MNLKPKELIQAAAVLSLTLLLAAAVLGASAAVGLAAFHWTGSLLGERIIQRS